MGTFQLLFEPGPSNPEVLATHKELAKKLEALERRIDSQDETIVEIVQAIRQLMTPPEPAKKRRIGFISED